MDRFLSRRPDEVARVFAQAGAARGLPPATVAKDFWVCVVLRELFALPEVGPHLTFKGGTSLSKAWDLIDRFSEDVDLTIDHQLLGIPTDQEPSVASSRTQQQRRLETIKAASRRIVPQRIATELTSQLTGLLGTRDWALTVDSRDPDQQTLLFTYPGTPGENVAGYLRPYVMLEFGGRGEPWPAEEREIRPIVAGAFPDLFDAPEVAIRALRPERTFWEKAMLLHEEQRRPGNRPVRQAMARHYYDVWRLIDRGVAADAADDIELFAQVAAHRELYFRHSSMDYSTLARGTIQMLPLGRHISEWRNDYVAMQDAMFVGTPPPFDEILAVIEQFQTAFNAT